MPSGKDRLYIGLHARSGKPKMPTLEDTYHWSLIIGPKKETASSMGIRFHAMNTIQPDGTVAWQFEEKKISLQPTDMLLARVCIGKVADNQRLHTVLRSVPVQQDVDDWNCVSWVQVALHLLQDDRNAVGTGQLDWSDVRECAMGYVERKKVEGRFDSSGGFDVDTIATYSLLEGRETTL
ncbi:hypothetical protein LTR97_000004 [Elasticomyces elasticus]|uniref:Uncharacterized protein n=1 Tax=Elasticomyces elasticus TaxID=574655 RepID=A0AAN7WIK2_9PEZI|nr:hypothetical protein LTR97_000004 [Elasticomyces elasticus]